MTRPLLAAIVIGVILGGTALYTQFLAYLRDRAAEEARARQEEIAHKAHGVFAVYVTLTGTAAPDDFTISEERPSVLVELRGAERKEIIRETGEIKAGETIKKKPVEGLREGENRFWVQFSPVASFDTGPFAVRIQVVKIVDKDHEIVLGENTFWGTNGANAGGLLIVNVAPDAELEGHE